MRIRQHLLLASATGALIGLSEGVAAARGGGVVTVLAALGLGGCGGALWGIVQWAIARAIAPLRRVAAEALALDVEDRSAVVRRHALVIAALALAPVFAVALGLLSRRLDALNSVEVAAALLAAAALAGLVGVGAGALILGGVLMRPLAWLDRRVGLPWPRAPLHRLLLYVAAPAAWVAEVTLRVGGGQLGALAIGAWAVQWLALELLIVVVALALVRRAPRAAKLGRGLAVTAVVLAIAGVALAEGRPAVHADLKATRAPALVRALLRRVADVDRDGAASLLGDRDCAPWDAAIGPLSVEVPDNDVDENCDGVDAKVRAKAMATFSDALPPLAVRRYNVLLIVVDAMRADYTHLLGYRKNNTPYLDRFAEQALVFERALSQSSVTMLSIPSIQSGRWPGSLHWKSLRDRMQLHESTPTLSERLGAAGYRTGIVGSNYFFNRLPGILRGHEFTRNFADDLPDRAAKRRTEAAATASAVEFLAPHISGHDERPFFLTVYHDDPHAPYVAHDAGYPPFGDDEKGRYAQEIAAVDRYIGILLEIVRYTDLWEDTIVIITADHGEEFGEHGGKLHAQTCFIESVHVPLLARIPGLPGGRHKAQVGLVDIVPTILELTGIDRGATLDGQSLLTHALAPELVEPNRPLFCSVLRKAETVQLRHSVRAGDLTLLHEESEGVYQLFDRSTDPAEKTALDGADEARAAQIETLKDLLRSQSIGNITLFAR